MAADGSGRHWALILAGGDGARLRELTRRITGAPIPKQFCRLFGDRSLLEATIARSEGFVARERILAVVNRDHLDVGGEQLSILPSRNVVVQPSNRDTGPGLLFSLLDLARRDPDATVAVFPSDHYIDDDRAFIAHVRRALSLLAEFPDKVIVLGICPDRPEPAYGYITLSRPVGASPAAFHVAAFCEKPEPAAAAALQRNGALWNSFVMVFRVRRMLELLQQVTPQDFETLRAVRMAPNAVWHIYRHMRPWNFSHDFLTRIPQHLIALRLADVHWSDVGTPESVYRTLATLGRPAPWWAAKPTPVAA